MQIKDIATSPDMDPKQDPQFMELMEAAIRGDVPVYFAGVPLAQCVPFDLDYRPDLHPAGAAGISECIERWKAGQFQKLVVYPKGAWFVVSDDYIQLFAALKGRPDFLPCWILGMPEAATLRQLQGPIEPADFARAIGIA